MKKLLKRTRMIIWGICILAYIGLFSVVIFNYTCSNRYFDFEAPDVIKANSGDEIAVVVRVNNKTYYDVSSKDGYFISYHILNMKKEMLYFDNQRSNIENINPGETGEVSMSIKVPEEKGTYFVAIDVVKEAQYWYGEKGNKAKNFKLIID